MKVPQSCLTLWDPIVHGILQVRILEWVAFPSIGHPRNPGIEPRSRALQADSLQAEPQGKPKNTRILYSPWNSVGQNTGVGSLSLL